MNAESGQGPPKWLQLRRTLGVLAPSIATLVLVVLLVFTVFFTAFDWHWIAFLSGILFAAVLSLASAYWKSASRSTRGTMTGPSPCSARRARLPAGERLPLHRGGAPAALNPRLRRPARRRSASA